MFKKILLPLDGSSNAEGALPWVVKYAAPSKTPVVLARVLERVYPLKGMPFGAEAEEARAYLERIGETLRSVGIPTEIVLPSDPVALSLVVAADRARCSVIVMTTRGASRLIRWLVGGVTEQVIRISTVPVLVVRGHDAIRPVVHPGRILVPVDGSPRLKEMIAWAERLALFHQSPLEILYVRPDGTARRAKVESTTAEVSRSAAHLCGLLRARGIAASFRLEEGDPAEEILKAYRRTDLLVMTTHGYRGLKRWVVGSKAEKLLHRTSGPIFISKSRSGPTGMA